MSAQGWFEREEDALVSEYNNGLMTQEEFNRAMRDLQREYREMAEDAAQDAYEREMNQW